MNYRGCEIKKCGSHYVILRYGDVIGSADTVEEAEEGIDELCDSEDEEDEEDE